MNGTSVPSPRPSDNATGKPPDEIELIKRLFPDRKDENIRTNLFALLGDEAFHKILHSPALETTEKQKTLIKLAQRLDSTISAATSSSNLASPSLRSSQVTFSDSVSNSVVELNIGGYHYIATMSTLCPPGQENYFHAMLRSGFAKLKDSKGRYFIDRNGRYFAPLLEYLRTNIWRVPPGFDECVLLEEAQFFGLKPAVEFTVSDAMLRDVYLEQQRTQSEQTMQEALERFGPAFKRLVDMTLPQLLAAARTGRPVASPWFFPSREDIAEAAAAVDPGLAKRVPAYLPDEYLYDTALHSVTVPTLLPFLKHKHNLTLRVAKRMFVASRHVAGGEWAIRHGFLEPEEVQKIEIDLTLRVLAAGWQLQWAPVPAPDRKILL